MVVKHGLLRKELRLMVLENRALELILMPKMDKNGKWRSLHNEEFHSLYYSPG